jgi:hypothetical protein
MLFGIKYSVPSKGILGNDVIWRIYRNVDQGFTDTIYVEHIEIEDGVDSWTGEQVYRIGYSLLCEGEIEVFTDEKTGRKHARIYR